jgi:hypothetical protein
MVRECSSRLASKKEHEPSAGTKRSNSVSQLLEVEETGNHLVVHAPHMRRRRRPSSMMMYVWSS